MSDLQKLLDEARRERVNIHHTEFSSGFHILSVAASGLATLSLMQMATDLAAALIKSREALELALDDLDEWTGCRDSLEKAGFNMDDTAERADKTRAALAEIDAMKGSTDEQE